MCVGKRRGRDYGLGVGFEVLVVGVGGRTRIERILVFGMGCWK